jgi:hypothetical protein
MACTKSAPVALAPPVASIGLPPPSIAEHNARTQLRTVPFGSLTVSGGVSLGAYEAGFLYYLTEVAKLPENKQSLDLKLVTGASAGNINALMTILALCGAPESNPQASLFWETWINVGFQQLFEVSDEPLPAGTVGAFSKSALLRISEKLEKPWKKGISATCDKILAVSTTRLKSTDVSLQDGFKVPKQEEKFVVRIRGRGEGQGPLASNYVDPNGPLPQPLLPFPVDQDSTDAQAKSLKLIRDLLLASSAFPMAFPAQVLPYCLTEGRHQNGNGDKPVSAASTATTVSKGKGIETECGEKAIFSESFIDGGVFDNTPLRLAHKLTGYLTPSGAWRDPEQPAPALTPATAPKKVGFLFIDPDTTAYPAADVTSSADKGMSVLPLGANFIQNFVATARSKELYTLIEEQPNLDVVLTRRYFPTASGHLANFFGFFEESFRRFDFYLGMYDAYRLASARFPRTLSMLRPDGAVWDPFACMLAAFADDEADQSACSVDPTACSALPLADCERKKRHSAAFRALLQVSIDRLYSECERLPPEALPTIDHHHCLMAMLRKPRRLVRNLPGYSPTAYRKRETETDFAHTLRLLDLYHFNFEDLNGPRSTGNSEEAMTKVRYQLARLVDRMADTQPFGDAFAMRLVGKPALNFIYYAPPETIAYASIGRGLEIGGSWLLGLGLGFGRLRLNGAMQFKGLEEVAFQSNGAIAFTPLIGLETELYGNPISQLRLGLRGGFQLSSKGITQGDCRRSDNNTLSNSRSDCSSFVAQLPLSWSAFERVRLQIVPEYLAPHPVLEGRSWNINFGFGGQLISPFF